MAAHNIAQERLIFCNLVCLFLFRAPQFALFPLPSRATSLLSILPHWLPISLLLFPRLQPLLRATPEEFGSCAVLLEWKAGDGWEKEWTQWPNWSDVVKLTPCALPAMGRAVARWHGMVARHQAHTARSPCPGWGKQCNLSCLSLQGKFWLSLLPCLSSQPGLSWERDLPAEHVVLQESRQELCLFLPRLCLTDTCVHHTSFMLHHTAPGLRPLPRARWW